MRQRWESTWVCRAKTWQHCIAVVFFIFD